MFCLELLTKDEVELRDSGDENGVAEDSSSYENGFETEVDDEDSQD